MTTLTNTNNKSIKGGNVMSCYMSLDELMYISEVVDEDDLDFFDIDFDDEDIEDDFDPLHFN